MLVSLVQSPEGCSSSATLSFIKVLLHNFYVWQVLLGQANLELTEISQHSDSFDIALQLQSIAVGQSTHASSDMKKVLLRAENIFYLFCKLKLSYCFANNKYRPM